MFTRTVLNLNFLFDMNSDEAIYETNIASGCNSTTSVGSICDSPVNADLMKFLIKIDKKLNDVENKLCSLKKWKPKLLS